MPQRLQVRDVQSMRCRPRGNPEAKANPRGAARVKLNFQTQAEDCLAAPKP